MPSSIRTSFIYYLVLLALHIGLLWWRPYFPTQDGPSHLYNLLILHDLLNGGKEWGPFFTHHLRPVPNLGFHIVAYPLLGFFSPLILEKLFVSIYIVLMGVSVPIFLRAFDRQIFPFAFLVFPAVFNFNLFMGFYSYVIAVPLFLMAISFAWKIRNTSACYKFVCLNLAGFILFYCHLIPFVFFLISLTAASVADATNWKKMLGNLTRLFITISPLLVIFFLYQVKSLKGPHLDLTYLSSLPRFVDLTAHLFLFSTANFSPLQLIPSALLMFVFLFFLRSFGHDAFKALRRMGPNTPGIPASEKTLILLALILVVIYFAAPFRFGEGSYFNQRFPWVIFLVMLPLLRVPAGVISGRFATAIIMAAVILVFVFNSIVMRQESAKVGEFLRGLNTGPPRGAFVMAYKTKFPEWSNIDVLRHAASYYGIYNGCVDLGNYEAGLPYFPVQFRKTLPALPSQDQVEYDPAKIRWSLYPCIRYIFGWDLETGERIKLGKEFDIIREDGRLTIWQRNLAPS